MKSATSPIRRLWNRPLAIATVLLFVCGPLLAPTASAAAGSLQGARVQVVVAGVREKDVATVNCLGPCILTWEATGSAVLTLRCLDDGVTSVSVFGRDLPRLPHPCIVESTLEIGGAVESVLVWRANACNDPVC